MDRPGTAVEGMREPAEGLRSRERLVVELASAVKMNQFGLPARLSPESLPLVEGWKKSIEETPGFLSHVEANVNKALSLIDKAERGQKVEMRPIEVKEEKPSESVNAKVTMIQDDDRKWALYIKPEGEKGLAMYPDKADLGRFFALAKQGGEKFEALRQELAQKYYRGPPSGTGAEILLPGHLTSGDEGGSLLQQGEGRGPVRRPACEYHPAEAQAWN